jgi:hypothetical protein
MAIRSPRMRHIVATDGSPAMGGVLDPNQFFVDTSGFQGVGEGPIPETSGWWSGLLARKPVV